MNVFVLGEIIQALKLDIARQIEELQQREQALRRREDSHRNFLHMLDFMRWNPIEWSEDCVCEWVQHIWTQYNSNTGNHFAFYCCEFFRKGKKL